MGNWIVQNPTLKAEQIVLGYISSSLASANLIDPSTQFYTGMANGDIVGPAVVVSCNSANETYWSTRIYSLELNITCRQMAYDSYTGSNLTSSITSLGGNIFSLFGSSDIASAGINNYVASSSNDFFTYQTQQGNYQNERYEDAWISSLDVKITGMLVQSVQSM